ncbi:MAG: hypothetical protein JWP89_5705 [Schlesneria sp.]|nr:hypothetical protein [Schlesneria sp.]
MSDAIFFLALGLVLIQAFILAAFYFTAYQRLFFTLGATNAVPFVLFLVFFNIGYLIAFIAGWARCDARQLGRVMVFWTFEMFVVVGEVSLLANMPSNGSELPQLVLSIIITAVMLSLCIAGLKEAYRVDGRLRMVVNDPTDANIKCVAELGTTMLPHVERLLENPYAPIRVIAVKCLGQMGTLGIALLQSSLEDEDQAVVTQADKLLAQVQQQTASA